eukprot:3901626-Prymnesium_polylepis.1
MEVGVSSASRVCPGPTGSAARLHEVHCKLRKTRGERSQADRGQPLLPCENQPAPGSAATRTSLSESCLAWGGP